MYKNENASMQGCGLWKLLVSEPESGKSKVHCIWALLLLDVAARFDIVHFGPFPLHYV